MRCLLVSLLLCCFNLAQTHLELFQEVISIYGNPPIIAQNDFIIQELRENFTEVDEVRIWLKSFDRLRDRLARLKAFREKNNLQNLPVAFDDYLTGNERNICNAIIIYYGSIVSAGMLDDLLTKGIYGSFFSSVFEFPAKETTIEGFTAFMQTWDSYPWYESVKLWKLPGAPDKAL